MRILYAVHGYKPAFRLGGPVESVSALAEGLVGRGHDVTVATTNSNLDQDLDVPLDQAVDVEGVKVWYFRRDEPLRRWLPFVPYLSKSIGFLYAPRMREALRQAVPGVDLVHTHIPFVYPTFAAARAARRSHKPLFYHQRGVFDPERLEFRSLKKRLYIRLVERPIMRQARMLLALTEAEVASYRALGVETPCRVVPNGVDISRYRTAPVKRPDTLAEIDDDALVVLFLGRLHPIKGADVLLQAFARIAAAFPTAVLVMAGPDEWGLIEGFRKNAGLARLGLRFFFPGMVSGEEKLNLLARADLFCLPSAGEGFSVAVLEALASATPVLLSPGCHFSEVEKAKAGRVVEPTPATLGDALAELLSDPGRLLAMGARGRELVARDYTWEAIVSRLEDVYREGTEGARP
jgi:glycosyltransferase involved in cell wall biosynthesis